MKWTDLIRDGIETNYRIADNLMAMVNDDDLGWKPASGSNWMTVGQLLMHITTACGFCCRGFVTGDWGMPGDGGDDAGGGDSMLPSAEALPAATSVRKARDLLAADKKLALEMVAQAGERKLDSETSAAPWDPEHPQLLGQHLLQMVLHLMAHKNQLFYYLKLMGRDVNTMNLWGM